MMRSAPAAPGESCWAPNAIPSPEDKQTLRGSNDPATSQPGVVWAPNAIPVTGSEGKSSHRSHVGVKPETAGEQKNVVNANRTTDPNDTDLEAAAETKQEAKTWWKAPLDTCIPRQHHCFAKAMLVFVITILLFWIGWALGTRDPSSNSQQQSKEPPSLPQQSSNNARPSPRPNNARPSPRPITAPIWTRPPSSPPTMAPTLDLFSLANDPLVDILPDYTMNAVHQSSRSPQAMAFQWLEHHPDIDGMPNWRKFQLMALATLYFSTGGSAAWSQDLSGYSAKDWLNENVHECQWVKSLYKRYSIKCSRFQQFTRVTFPPLHGTIPPELAFLTAIKSLYLDNSNSLEGSIPSTIGLMTALQRLNLKGNQLTGQLPSELGLMTALTHMNLAANQLTGTIPATFSQLSHMVWLELHTNHLGGSIPSFVASMVGLHSLGVGKNNLTGQIPSELGLLRHAKYLDVSGNKVTGTVPHEICELEKGKIYYDPEMVSCDCVAVSHQVCRGLP